MKLAIESGAGDDIEEKIHRIVERMTRIRDTFFIHPVKLRALRLPFDEYDTLRIKFKQPVKLSYNVEYSNPIDNKCKAIITADYTCRDATEVMIEIEKDAIGIVTIVTEDGSYHSFIPLSNSNLLFLSTLFVPDTKIEEAEISSNKKLVANWFTELIETYKEVSKYTTQIDLHDLYDYMLLVSNVDLNIFYRSSLISMKLDRERNVLWIETVKSYSIYTPIPYVTYLYHLQSGKFQEIVSLDTTTNARETSRKIVATLPEKIFDDINDFLIKLFKAYTSLVVTIRYLTYV